MTLTEKFEKNLSYDKNILPGEKVLIACSGGPDSIALVYLLKGLQKSWNLDLGILHFNHCLRGRDSSLDEKFVKDTARKLRIPFYSARGKVKKKASAEKWSLEEAARFARYGFFVKKAKRLKAHKVVLAHTIDDQAETVLMRLFQGTGLRGLCGIRKVKRLEGISFVRPFLELEKQEILLFLKKNKTAFRLDKSNRQESFLRNRIRLKIMPVLKKDVNPGIVRALARIPSIVSDELALISGIEEDAWRNSFQSRKGRVLKLRREAFLSYPAPLQFRLLERGLKRMDPRSGINFEAWQRIRKNLSQKTYRCSLPKDIDFILTASDLKLYKK